MAVMDWLDRNEKRIDRLGWLVLLLGALYFAGHVAVAVMR